MGGQRGGPGGGTIGMSGLPDGNWSASYKPAQMGPQAQAFNQAQQLRSQGNDARYTALQGGALQGLAGLAGPGGVPPSWSDALSKIQSMAATGGGPFKSQQNRLAAGNNPGGVPIQTYDQANARFADYNPTGPQVNSQVGYSGAYGVPGWNNGTIPTMPASPVSGGFSAMTGRPMYGGAFGSPGGIGPGGIYNIMQALAGGGRPRVYGTM